MSTESTAAPVTAADLRPVDLFDDLDDAALAEWAAVAEWRTADSDEVVIAGDEPSKGLWCLLEGSAADVRARRRAPRACRPPGRSDMDRRRSDAHRDPDDALAWSRSPPSGWR